MESEFKEFRLCDVLRHGLSPHGVTHDEFAGAMVKWANFRSPSDCARLAERCTIPSTWANKGAWWTDRIYFNRDSAGKLYAQYYAGQDYSSERREIMKALRQV